MCSSYKSRLLDLGSGSDLGLILWLQEQEHALETVKTESAYIHKVAVLGRTDSGMVSFERGLKKLFDHYCKQGEKIVVENLYCPPSIEFAVCFVFGPRTRMSPPLDSTCCCQVLGMKWEANLLARRNYLCVSS